MDHIVKIAWNDTGYQDQRPESVKCHLYLNNTLIDTKELTADNEWTVEWLNLMEASDLVYTVDTSLTIPAYEMSNREQTNVDQAYTTTFTMRYNGTTTISYDFVVHWVGDESHLEDRPAEVTVDIIRQQDNGVETTVQVSANENWTKNVTDLPANNTYYCQQHAIDYYETTGGGGTTNGNITNTYVGRPEPPTPKPVPGDHPTKDDYDLMYSVLYDDISYDNMVELIHVLNYGTRQ